FSWLFFRPSRRRRRRLSVSSRITRILEAKCLVLAPANRARMFGPVFRSSGDSGRSVVKLRVLERMPVRSAKILLACTALLLGQIAAAQQPEVQFLRTWQPTDGKLLAEVSGFALAAD